MRPEFFRFSKNAQNAKCTFEMLKRQVSQVSVDGLKSLDVSPCNELLLLPMTIKKLLSLTILLRDVNDVIARIPLHINL